MRFDNAVYNVDENNGLVQPNLIFSNPSSFVEIVQVNNIDITATGKVNFVMYLLHIVTILTGEGVDYNSGPYNAIFPIGSTNASFAIIINDDSLMERDEKFNISVVSFTSGHIVGTLGEATIFIRDTTSEYRYNTSLYVVMLGFTISSLYMLLAKYINIFLI